MNSGNRTLANLKPEEELLLCSASATVSADVAARIRALARSGVNWDKLLRLSINHGLPQLLYRNLNAICPELVSQEILRGLRTVFQNNAAHNSFLTVEMLNLVSLFERNGVRAIPYKGPLLASSVYGSIALRQFCDLDILVRKQDVARARALLAAEGYSAPADLTPEQEAALVEADCEYAFYHDRKRLYVELHWAIAKKYFSFDLDLDSVWERAEAETLDGKPLSTFAAEDLLLILCLHGAKHMWERLAWVCDLAETMREKRINWAELLERAKQARVERVVLSGLLLAHDLLGAALPQEVLRAVEADPKVKAISARAAKRMFVDADRSPALLKKIGFHLGAIAMLKSAREKARYLLSLAFTPTVDDWTRLRSRPRFARLHLLLRPFRLLGKYARLS